MGDQVNPNAVFQNIHIWTLFDLLTEGGGHYKAGRIGRVDDAATAVATFFSQVIGKAAVVIAFFFREAHALFNKPLNRIAAVFDSEPYGVFVAEARPGAQGIFNVGFNGIGLVQYGSNATLSLSRGATLQGGFAKDGDF